MTFSTLDIDSDIVDALEARGITDAFPIQQQCIPLALSGTDIIGQAKTGTGKTFAFGIPVAQRIGAEPTPGVKVLIVVPTRELATQVSQDMELITSGRGSSVVTVYGGKSYEEQIEKIQAGAQIVVGTPGRLLDLAGRRLLPLGEVQEMVLDEADKMLDLGFLPDVEKLFSMTPAKRHTMLFSATMPGQVISLARRFMSRPMHIRATDPLEGKTQANIRHLVYRAHQLDKDEVIGRILQAEGRGKTLIFTRTKRAASKLVEELIDRGFAAAAVHGDMRQEGRERAMQAFKAGKKDVLIATDVASRGIDVDDVTHVINHTIPDDEETYLHRVGRTGRAGRTGIAVTFVDWEDLHKWSLINKALEMDQPEPVETYSSSPHLFAELSIPEGSKGRLQATPVAKDRPTAGSGQRRDDQGRQSDRSRGRRRGSRGGSGAQGSGEQGSGEQGSQETGQQEPKSSGADAQGAGAGDQPKRRRRRRRRSGGDSSAPAQTAAE